MKIVFVLTQSLDSPSGLGRFGPLARELARIGHEVTVLALHYDWAGLAQKQFIDQGVRVAYVGQMHVRKEGPRKGYFSPGRLLLVGMQSTYSLARALARSEAEIIQVCKPQPFNTLAARLARRGRPIYYDCDDYEAASNRFSGAWQQRIVRYFEDSVVSHARALTTNTHFTAQRYAQLGFPAERIVYVPNGVERQRFARPANPAMLRRQWGLEADAPVILYIGSLSMPSHPIDLLLQAFQQLARAVPAARLLLVGGGEDYDRLQQMAGELGVADKTIFAGRVAADDSPAYLALAAVTVDPVHDDPAARARSPLKVVESIVAGVPVVTGDVGDRREMLEDGALGCVVQPGDAPALADALIQLLQEPERRRQMAEAALASRDKWYWDRLVQRFAAVYERGPDALR
jgi:glycosyltransferase involved in cell wall biosynthesis